MSDKPRNLVQFSTADAEVVLGRPLTRAEERRLVKMLEFSSLAEVFAEVVNLATEETA